MQLLQLPEIWLPASTVHPSGYVTAEEGDRMETPVKDSICQRKKNPMVSRCVMFIHIALVDCNRIREECDFTFLKHTLLC